MTDITKLAREIVENLVDCGAADEAFENQYLEWTKGKLLTCIKSHAERIAELESRTVKLPESFYPDGDIDCPLVLNEHEVIEVIESAGVNVIKWEPE